MSILKVDAIRHNSATSDAITMASDGTCTAKVTSINGGQLSHRNKVINGGMLINQRASSYTSTGTEYTLDRFQHSAGSAFTFDTTLTQDSSTPDGFSKSLKITPDSTQTPTGSHNGTLKQMIEGQDLQDLAFGTSSAKSVTVSFYAKSASSNNNHQYGLQLRTRDSSAQARYVSQAFTVTTSWQRYTMTFAGNTSVAIRNDNGNGFEICFHLASGPDDIVSAKSTWTTSSAFQTVTGQSNFMDNTSNEFYLTGVQLEVGDTATSFEHRSYAEELHRCQRYFAIFPGRSGGIPFWIGYAGSSNGYCSIPVPNFNFRVVPTPTDATTGTSTSNGNLYDVYGNNLNSRYAGNGTVTLSCGGYAPSGIGLIMDFGAHQSGTKEHVVASWNGASPGIFLSAEF